MKNQQRAYLFGYIAVIAIVFGPLVSYFLLKSTTLAGVCALIGLVSLIPCRHYARADWTK